MESRESKSTACVRKRTFHGRNSIKSGIGRRSEEEEAYSAMRTKKSCYEGKGKGDSQYMRKKSGVTIDWGGDAKVHLQGASGF